MSHIQSPMGEAHALINQWILEKLDTQINSPAYLLEGVQYNTSEPLTFLRDRFLDFIGTSPFNPIKFSRLSRGEKTYLLNSVFEVYVPALLHLFFSPSLSERQRCKTFWNEKLTLPSGEKNLFFPIPYLYQQAKRTFLHPLAMPLEYGLARPIQKKITEYPKLSITATSLLVALNPSIFSLGFSLWTGLSLVFNTPKQHGEIAKTLWNTAQYFALYSFIGSVLFPLILNGLVDNSFPLRANQLFQFAALLLGNFLIELKTAFNHYHFEQENPYQIEGTPKALKKVMLKNTFSPVLYPALAASAVSVSLALPLNSLLPGVLTLTEIYSLMNGIRSAAKLLRREASPEEALNVIFILASSSYALNFLKVLTGKPCLEIEKGSTFGINTLMVPDSDPHFRPCHENSGKLWNARPLDSKNLQTFTAESLQYGYVQTTYSNLTEGNYASPSALSFWLDPSKAINPIQNFCKLVAKGHCYSNAITNQFSVINPPLLITAESSTPFKAALITTTQHNTEASRAAAMLFLGMRAVQLSKASGSGVTRSESKPE